VTKDIKKSNKNDEFLLDIQPFYTGQEWVYIYDISPFLPTGKCQVRDSYVDRIAHVISHDNFTFLLIDRDNVLNPIQADEVVRRWHDENETVYRLDKRNRS